MRFTLSLLCALCLLGFVGGCGTDDVSTPTTPLVTGEMEDAPPAVSGVVIRDTGFGWFVVGDADWTIFFGIEDIRTICTGDPLVWDTLNYMQVYSEGGAVTTLFNTMVTVNVYPAIPITCSGVIDTPQFATGVVKFVRPDNDYYVQGPGANAFSEHLTGTVYTPDGDAFNLLVSATYLIPPGGDETSPWETKQLKIQLSPKP